MISSRVPARSFHIVRISVGPHHKMYDELASSLTAGLVELGHSCTSAINLLRPGPVNILLGSTIFAARMLDLTRHLREQPYLLYQLEQLDDARGLLKEWPEYREILAGARQIWDYAPSSSAYLRERGFAAVGTLPPGYHPCLETIGPAAGPEIDVLFVGSPHSRRRRILDALRRAGAAVVPVEGLYGEQRDRLIARAKIVLNIHAWDGLDALETVRLSFLLANRRFVVSETGDHNPYGKGVVFAAYEDLVETCLYYLRQPARHRETIAERGYQAVRGQPMIDSLKTVLEVV